MLDDIRTTPRWFSGAASLGFVALALVVGLLLAGDDDDDAATPVAPTATTAAGSETSGGREGSPNGGFCEAAGAGCGSPYSRHATGGDPSESGSVVPASAADESADGIDPSAQEQEQGRRTEVTEPNVNPDHYGPGGEPVAEPSVPAAEGALDETATAPNRNPNH